MVWFNRKVLLVENESLLRSLIASTLQFEQFDVAATTSAEAREVAVDFEAHPALKNAVCIDRADLAKPGVLRAALDTADADRAA